jgi:hypothetical protein
MNGKTLASRLAIALAAGSLFALAARASAGDFACYVRIAGDKPAITLIETDTREHALRMAAGVTARAGDGSRGPVVRVVQCIDRHREQFADSHAQNLFSEHGL